MLKEEPEIKTTFRSPVIAFIYPDHEQIERLKKENGVDYFYSHSDKNGADFIKSRHLAENHNLPVYSGTTGKYRFISPDGMIIDANTSESDQPWKIIIFNGKDAPVIANPAEAEMMIAIAFNLHQKQPFKKPITISKTVIPPLLPQLQQDNPLSFIDSLPGLKETTLRLLIFPGQGSPPLRDETAGLHIVNSYISPGRRFWLEFDNDLFSNTDRYYTNGVVFGYTAPGLTTMGLNRLMVALNRNNVVHSSISLHHSMFTPLTTKVPPPLIYDRPYASTLYLRYSQVSEDATEGISLTSAIEAGVIGDAALGQMLQRSVHAGIPSNDEPRGWETQIKNDLVLNYNVNFQKQLVKKQHAEVFAEGSAVAGTLHTRAAIGINAVAGVYRPILTPFPEQNDQPSVKTRPVQFSARGGLELRMIGYDATLQGGMFNKNNIYALKPDEIERLVAALHFGIFVNYRNLGISISQFYLSPEFEEGRQHFWGQIGLEYGW